MKKRVLNIDYNVNSRALDVIPLLSDINKGLTKIGFNGMGPVSKKSLGYYIGRWYDKETARIRTLLKPKMDFNPTEQR